MSLQYKAMQDEYLALKSTHT